MAKLKLKLKAPATMANNEKTATSDKGKDKAIEHGKRKRTTPDHISEPEPTRRRVHLNKDDASGFLNRVTPKQLVPFMRGLDEQQKMLVEEVGWGHLLNLDITKFPDPEFSRWLVENFKVSSSRLKLQDGWLDITEDDVEACFGLPHGEVDVVKAGPQDTNVEYRHLLDGMRADFELGENKLTVLPAKMQRFLLTGQRTDNIVPVENRPVYGNKFKRYFILQAVSSIFARTKSSGCKYTLLKSLADTDGLKNLNWCKYILNSLLESVEKWKQKPKGHFDGPLLFLMVCYLDRVQFKNLYKDRRLFPVAYNWTDMVISDRIKKEKRTDGFGSGKIMPRIELLRSVEVEEEHGRIDNREIGTTSEEPKEVVLAREFEDIVVNNLGPLALRLGSLFERARKFNIKENANFTKFFSNYGLLFHQMAQQPKSQAEIIMTQIATQGHDDSPMSTQELDFWNSKELEEALQKATASVVEGRRKMLDVPTFDLLPETDDDLRTCVESLAHLATSPPHETMNTPIVAPIENTSISAAKTPPQLKKASTNVAKTPPPMEKGVISPLQVESYLKTTLKGQDNTSGMKAATVLKLYKSPFWKKKGARTKYHYVANREAILSDFVFSGREGKEYETDDFNGDFLYLKGSSDDVHYRVDRTGLKSLKPGGKIDIDVINAFAAHMNHTHKTTVGRSRRKKFWFSAQASTVLKPCMHKEDKSIWNTLVNEAIQLLALDLKNDKITRAEALKVEDFYIPIFASEHYYLFCINVAKKCVHVVDNLKSLVSDEDGSDIPFENKYGPIYDFMTGAFIYVLRSFIGQFLQIPEPSQFTWQVISVPSWQDSRTEKNVIDCGVFLMRHMETYETEDKIRENSYDNGIPAIETGRMKSKCEERINSLRFQYLVAILESETNSLTDKLEQDLLKFYVPVQ